MKRLIINLIFLCICTCLVLCACGKKDKERGSNNNHETVAEEAQEEKWGFDINYVNPEYVEEWDETVVWDENNMVDLSDYIDIKVISADSAGVTYQVRQIKEFDLIERMKDLYIDSNGRVYMLNDGKWENVAKHVKLEYSFVVTDNTYRLITNEGTEVRNDFLGYELPEGHYKIKTRLSPANKGVYPGTVDGYYTEFEFDIPCGES